MNDHLTSTTSPQRRRLCHVHEQDAPDPCTRSSGQSSMETSVALELLIYDKDGPDGLVNEGLGPTARDRPVIDVASESAVETVAKETRSRRSGEMPSTG